MLVNPWVPVKPMSFLQFGSYSLIVRLVRTITYCADEAERESLASL